jgi:hypothetical protein
MTRRIITVVLLLPFLYAGAVYYASEYGGETVELETIDVFGRIFPTTVWIVDAYGDTWIRADDPESVWLQRIRINPVVYVTRKGVKAEYRAEVVDGFTSQINEAMREKYGRADEVIAPLRDPDEAVAIRLARTS